MTFHDISWLSDSCWIWTCCSSCLTLVQKPRSAIVQHFDCFVLETWSGTPLCVSLLSMQWGPKTGHGAKSCGITNLAEVSRPASDEAWHVPWLRRCQVGLICETYVGADGPLKIHTCSQEIAHRCIILSSWRCWSFPFSCNIYILIYINYIYIIYIIYIEH